jgi:hypothetical protein
MPATVLCLVTALGSPLLVGVPVRWLLRRGRPLNERAWLEAPFVGLATIILVLQNLVYLNVPVRRSAPWFWLVVGLLWLVILWRRGLRESWRHCPRAVLAACAGVYLIQGLGLFLVGAPSYLGHRMSDQFNYIAMAQFLTDCPFTTSPDQIGPRPYLLRALLFKDDRIGQAVLHGFLAVSARQEMPTLYEATSLFGPALVVIPFYWLARGLGQRRRAALLLGVTAGLLPAVTELHLEGFLSQTVALPFLFALLVTFHRVLVTASVERAVVAMLVMACAASVYTELLPILAGLLLVLLIARRLTGHPWKTGAALAAAVLLAPALLNPLSLPHQLPALQRLSFVPFAKYFETRLHALPDLIWLGEEFRPLGWTHGVRAVGSVLMVLGILGLVWMGLSQWRRGRRRPAFLLALGALALASLPALALLRRPLNPYPVYKLALTCGPLLALGLGLLLPRGRLALLLLVTTATVLMESESAWHGHTPYAHVRSLLADDFRWAEGQMRQLGAGEVFLAVEEDFHAPWLSYHGRHHPLWLLPAPAAGPALPARPPAGTPVYLLVEDPLWPVRAEPGQGVLLATRGRFSLWQWNGIPVLPAPPPRPGPRSGGK